MPADAEIVRTGIELFNRRDFEGSIAAFGPGIVWRTGLQPLLGADAAHGVDEVLAFWAETVDGFDDFHIEVLATEEPRPGCVLVELRYHGRGHASGLELDTHAWSIYRLEGQSIVSVRDYPSREAALEELDGA
jgi:limonene-1,2-epoxide hydrolase